VVIDKMALKNLVVIDKMALKNLVVIDKTALKNLVERRMLLIFVKNIGYGRYSL
jgi:hypothetical protein